VTNPQDIADKLRELAARTAAQAREKRNPAIANQNPTRRRMNIAASMREDADRLDRLVMVLAGLADDHENGGAPEILAGVRNRAQVESLLSYKPGREPWGDHVQRLERIGIVGRYRWTEAAVWARSYLRPKSAVETQAERVRRMEAELIGMKLPGFFPTPAAVIETMLRVAEIPHDARVLEPSAGKGDILDALRDAHPSAKRCGYELRPGLAAICKAKGHECSALDFLEARAAAMWDRVVMNPPFEQLADIDHVRHAWNHLAEGGRLVSVTSAGPWFRKDRKAVEFREWVDDRGGWTMKLPDDAFKKAFRSTSVSTRLLVVDR
jgi:hypothetical protein